MIQTFSRISLWFECLLIFLVKLQCKLFKHHFHEFDFRYFSREIAMQISQNAFSRVFRYFSREIGVWNRVFTIFLETKSKIKPISVGPLWRSKVRELASARALIRPLHFWKASSVMNWLPWDSLSSLSSSVVYLAFTYWSIESERKNR